MGQITAELAFADEHRSVVRVHGLEVDPVEMWVESEGTLSDTLTGWVPVLTVLAGCTGHDLVLDGAVDTTAVENAQRAQQLQAGWFPDEVTPGAISATSASDEAGGPSQAVLFSGGVDSFFTLRRHLDEVGHLLLIHGMDISFDDTDLFSKTRAQLEEAAAEIGKPLVVARTNIRAVMDRYADWVLHYHGSAIATVSQLHSPMWHRVYLAATHSLDGHRPLGSHPSLDPLWSSAASEIVNDGAVYRSEKIAALASWDVAMNHLRVCWLNPAEYNCGRCNKCTRTMIGLHIAGALQLCRTMPDQLDYRRVVTTSVGENSPAYMADNLRAARAMRPRDRRLETALLLSLARFHYRRTPIAPPIGRARRRAVAAVRMIWPRTPDS